ncbi:hypothetical protein JCM5296_000694 [Sporobolomyces johnsonii]
MNQIQQIQRINEQELESGATASWHDQYKDSAYINVGGLPFNLTEGDVIAIFSQYGEIVDINMPRDPNTGKTRGFAWIMYYDQRSTVLAVDNLNGAKVLGRMLRVDHTLNYKQMERDEESGKMREKDSQSFAADPRNFVKPLAGDDSGAESDVSLGSVDPEDPMAEYILAQKRESKKRKLESGSGGESREERKRRKEERRRKREERERRKERKAIEESGGSRRVEGRSEREGSERRRDERGRDERRRDDRPRERERERDRDAGRRPDDYERRTDDRDRDAGSRRYDDRQRVDRDRDYRRRDDRERDERGGRGGGTGGAFADLEKWARR